MTLFNLHPWQLEIDAHKTKLYYIDNDLSIERKLNKDFEAIIDPKTKQFFNNFGVDIQRIKISLLKAIPNIEKESLLASNCYRVDFIVAGAIKAMPEDQWDLYFDWFEEEPPIFKIDESTPIRVEVDEETISHYQSEELMGIYKFSPGSMFDQSFEGFNSGYLYCKALINV